MASVDLLAGTVMDAVAAALMNDAARTTYTYTVQVPFLNMALSELQEYFQLHSIPVTEDSSAVIEVDAGDTEIIFNGGAGVPTLPDDFIEPKQLWERNRGIDPFIPMSKKDFIPHQLSGILTNQFSIYVWQSQKIKVPASNQNNDIKIDYVKQLFTPVVDENSIINIINAKTFLEYRTGALLCEFVERNKTSSDALNVYAQLAIDRATGISIKGKQNIGTRRRPFRSAYKRRGSAF